MGLRLTASCVATLCSLCVAPFGCSDSSSGDPVDPDSDASDAGRGGAGGSAGAGNGGTTAAGTGGGGSTSVSDAAIDGSHDASSPDGGGAGGTAGSGGKGGASGSGGAPDSGSDSGGCRPGASASNPFAGARFFVDPNSKAKQQADSWRAARPADAAALDKLAGASWSRWLGDYSGDIAAAARREVDNVTAQCALPVLVAYNIPNRDCGGHSGGGAGTAAAYKTWIRGLSAGIDGRRAVVILEPDALALQCADAEGNKERYALLSDAVNVLTASPNVFVYIDAGHSDWTAASDMAARLESSGIAKARGFSVNVSNFRTTAAEVAYGNAIVAALGGGKKFIIDTSRNGLGYNGQWCNPAGRALGMRATANTGYPNVDAFYWVKTPGLSDGECNGGPAAGTWWPEYALGLVERAAW